MSRSKHHGCGKSCSLCKPWKHGFEDKLKPSERRAIQDEADDFGYLDNVVTLSERDWEALQKMWDDPPEPSEKLKALFKEFKEML